jgi:hypothetical protein
MGRSGRNELEEAVCVPLIVAEALGACDCFGDVRDDSLAPAPDLIAEDAEAGKASTSDRTFDRDPPRRAIGVRDGPRVLDHEAPFRHPYLERCVVEVERSPALAACADSLVDVPVEANEVSTRAEREPVEIDTGFDRA